MEQFGKTVQDAIAFYLAHLRQAKKSAPLAEAIAEDADWDSWSDEPDGETVLTELRA